jgi:hypothetical protein
MAALRIFLRESWDLFGIAFVAVLALMLLLYWAGAVTLGTVAIGTPVLTIVLVFCGLWMLAIAGGSIPW